MKPVRIPVRRRPGEFSIACVMALITQETLPDPQLSLKVSKALREQLLIGESQKGVMATLWPGRSTPWQEDPNSQSYNVNYFLFTLHRNTDFNSISERMRMMLPGFGSRSIALSMVSYSQSTQRQYAESILNTYTGFQSTDTMFFGGRRSKSLWEQAKGSESEAEWNARIIEGRAGEAFIRATLHLATARQQAKAS